jgi:metallo-beta-lactamase family protein
MSNSISFFGAAGTVTGSKYLLQIDDKKILVDAGLFQGERRWREENWSEPGFDLAGVNAVLLTHAHIDHIGILPRYVAQGLNCPVYATPATIALARLLLLDSARLQEEEANYRERSGHSRHHPPLPLYREDDAQRALKLLQPVAVGQAQQIFPKVSASWSRMGHILGACAISVQAGERRVVFSGDIGRYNVPILRDPQAINLSSDLLLIESTYAQRIHPAERAPEALAKVINATYKRGGVVVIPSFAVGRAQLLLYYLRELKEANKIPDLPIIVDSPMADDATALYAAFPDDYDEAALQVVRAGRRPFSCSKLGFAQDSSESRRLNGIDQPMVIISASGMLSGGRVLHHLKHRISDPRNCILFVGFAAGWARGLD